MANSDNLTQFHTFPQTCFRRTIAQMGLCLMASIGLVATWGCTRNLASSMAAPRCSSSVQTKVSAAKPTVTVVYTEPTVNQAGNPLKELAKTTIYYDLGTGRTLAREVPSTKPTGGGQISQIITVPAPHQQETVVRICVTATDRHGNESAMTP